MFVSRSKKHSEQVGVKNIIPTPLSRVKHTLQPARAQKNILMGLGIEPIGFRGAQKVEQSDSKALEVRANRSEGLRISIDG